MIGILEQESAYPQKRGKCINYNGNVYGHAREKGKV
jgi:hypothetical protein